MAPTVAPGPGRGSYRGSGQRSSGSRPLVSGRRAKSPVAAMTGRNVMAPPSANRLPTSAMAPKATRPTVAPATLATTIHPATEARTAVGKDASEQEPPQAEERRHAHHGGLLGARHFEDVLGVDEDEAVGGPGHHG